MGRILLLLSQKFKLIRGDLLYIKDGNEGLDYRQSFPFDEKVSAFYSKDTWLLGKTKKGYFAINMQSQEIHYPLASEQEVISLSNIIVKPEDWIDSEKERMSSEYLLRNQAVVSFGKIFNVAFWVLFTCLCVGLFFWIKKKPKV